MKSDPNDFETLRKLMALKRYEQPPPGYFRRLPDRIEARLERGEGQLGIWERFIVPFTFRPALVYGFAMAALSVFHQDASGPIRPKAAQKRLAQRPGGRCLVQPVLSIPTAAPGQLDGKRQWEQPGPDPALVFWLRRATVHRPFCRQPALKGVARGI
jgi:hypothetical protein